MRTDADTRQSWRITLMAAFMTAVATLGLALLPNLASSASATLLPNCGARTASTVFSSWGDAKSYFLMPGGSFESGAPGWTTPGSSVVSGSETYHVNGAKDAHSLAIPNAATVVSPTICVAMGESTVRLFAKSNGGTASILHVQAFVQNPLTGLVLATAYDLKGNATKTWSPTPTLLVPNLLGGVLGVQNLTLVFTTKGTPTTWNIDDVYVDPFKSR